MRETGTWHVRKDVCRGCLTTRCHNSHGIKTLDDTESSSVLYSCARRHRVVEHPVLVYYVTTSRRIASSALGSIVHTKYERMLSHAQTIRRQSRVGHWRQQRYWQGHGPHVCPGGGAGGHRGTPRRRGDADSRGPRSSRGPLCVDDVSELG